MADLKPSTAPAASALDGTEAIPCAQGGASKALTPAQIKTYVGAVESGGAAGGDLSGTYPNPTVVDDGHSHTAATLPAASISVSGVAKQIAIEIPPFTSTGDDTAIFQDAIDYAATLPTGGTVLLPAGSFTTGKLLLRTRVNLVGQGRSTRLVAAAGATGGLLELASTSTERILLQDFWIEGNLANATVSGILLDNTGGTLTGGGTEIVIRNVVITNVALHGVHLVEALATKLFQVRVRSASLDGFLIDATDCQLVECSVSPCGRYGLHINKHVNMVAAMKIGETGSHGVYLTATAYSNALAALNVDAATGDAFHILGNYNSLTAASASRPSGNGFHITGIRNTVKGVATPQAGTMPYAVLYAGSAAGNSVGVGVQSAPVSGLIGGPFIDNRTVINGTDFSATVPITRWIATAGTPTVGTSTGLRIATVNLATNGDEVCGHAILIPPMWRGRQVAVSIGYSVATGDAAKDIQWSIGLSGLAAADPVTTVDVAFSRTIAAPATASIVQWQTFSLAGEILTIGAADVEGSITIKRDATSTTLVGALHIHHVLLALVG